MLHKLAQVSSLRVIAQLINTRDGSHLWSSTFDGEFSNIFELQDKITQKLTEQLQVTVSDLE